jgi:hypothetical protein
MLYELLRRRRGEIVHAWIEDTLASYSERAAEAWARERDPFANPVGHSLRVGMSAVVEWLLDGTDPESMRRGLDDILRIRAVQEFTPAQAVGFVARLKGILRRSTGARVDDDDARAELLELETRVDEVGLLAFDLYTQHRQRLYEGRVRELKRTIPWASTRAAQATVKGGGT